MYKPIALLIALASLSAVAQTDIITLDLTKAATPLTFDKSNGMWTDTYTDEIESIDSQCFQFVHSAINDMSCWWGFTASNCADNSAPTNVITDQYAAMARGGIVLDAAGEVARDADGNIATDSSVPYLVAYYGSYFSARPVSMHFADSRLYEPVGVYLNNNALSYYAVEQGMAPAREFGNTDRLWVTIHGVAADGSEREVEATLASYAGGDLTVNRGWKYVDLASLGAVNELYFTVHTTDIGAWGANTPTYFCLDKLMVRPSAAESVRSAVTAERNPIIYDPRSQRISFGAESPATIYTADGIAVMAAEQPIADISALPAGLYIIRTANHSLKIIK